MSRNFAFSSEQILVKKVYVVKVLLDKSCVAQFDDKLTLILIQTLAKR